MRRRCAPVANLIQQSVRYESVLSTLSLSLDLIFSCVVFSNEGALLWLVLIGPMYYLYGTIKRQSILVILMIAICRSQRTFQRISTIIRNELYNAYGAVSVSFGYIPVNFL